MAAAGGGDERHLYAVLAKLKDNNPNRVDNKSRVVVSARGRIAEGYKGTGYTLLGFFVGGGDDGTLEMWVKERKAASAAVVAPRSLEKLCHETPVFTVSPKLLQSEACNLAHTSPASTKVWVVGMPHTWAPKEAYWGALIDTFIRNLSSTSSRTLAQGWILFTGPRPPREPRARKYATKAELEELRKHVDSFHRESLVRDTVGAIATMREDRAIDEVGDDVHEHVSTLEQRVAALEKKLKNSNKTLHAEIKKVDQDVHGDKEAPVKTKKKKKKKENKESDAIEARVRERLKQWVTLGRPKGVGHLTGIWKDVPKEMQKKLKDEFNLQGEHPSLLFGAIAPSSSSSTAGGGFGAGYNDYEF